MDQALALELLRSGENVLLTGPAGSGKTYVLNRFIKEAKANKRHVAVTASTGLAATHLGGTTIHSWSGIGIHDELRDDFDDHLLKSRRDTIVLSDILIIDEISMLHDFRLDMVDEVARRVRGVDEPFGGLQVVLCGDFFQLPPINREGSRQGGFVVHSQVWEELDPVICYLEEQHRQDDDRFLEILNALRAGDIRRNHAESLLERVGAQLEEGEVTQLHTVNVDVDRINTQKLAELDSPAKLFHMTTTGKDSYVDSLKRSCLAQETVILKKDALVMTIKNNPEKKYVNGSLGRVVDFEPVTNYPIVEFYANGKRHTIMPESWELRDGDKKRAGLNQLPLRLAWAITVHKSQGMTLDAAVIDLRRAFVEGMGYVALSRVKRLESFSLVGINQMALRISQDALEIDGRLRSQSASDHKRFAHLKKQATKAFAMKETVEKKSGWTERLAKMRETHPNAYRPWSDKDDSLLKESFQMGEGLDVLSGKLGRHERSITMRLQKHFGEDVAL